MKRDHNTRIFSASLQVVGVRVVVVEGVVTVASLRD